MYPEIVYASKQLPIGFLTLLWCTFCQQQDAIKAHTQQQCRPHVLTGGLRRKYSISIPSDRTWTQLQQQLLPPMLARL